jgi:hypothetical protein
MPDDILRNRQGKSLFLWQAEIDAPDDPAKQSMRDGDHMAVQAAEPVTNMT